jgi:uncharacterized RDD family membrane protein YckC
VSSDREKNAGSSAFKIELEDAPAPAPKPSFTLVPEAAPSSLPSTAPPTRPATIPSAVPRAPRAPLRPTPVEEALEPAGVLIRAAALITDLCLILMISGLMRKSNSPVFLTILHIIYFTGWQCSPLSATPGKFVMGLQAVDLQGKQLTPGRALARELASVLSSWFLYLGYLIALGSEKKLTLHDRIAGTRVVRKRLVSSGLAAAVVLGVVLACAKFTPPMGSGGLKGKLFTSTGLKPVNELATDPCVSKEYCVITYVTPWCPACHGAKPMIGQLRDYLNASPRVGYKMIVGQDQAANLETEAKSLGDSTLMDTDGSFANRLGIHSYPTWLVVRTYDGKIMSQPDSITTNRLLTPEELKDFTPNFLKLDPEILSR